MITFQKQQLRAALECAATKDVRYYLCGVYIEVTPSGRLYIVSTDGAHMFVGRVNPVWTGEPQNGPWSMIIPADTIKRECKGKGEVTLAVDPTGSRYTLGASLFTPVDGHFPDFRRVIPSLNGPREGVAQFDPSLIKSAADALVTWGGLKSTASTHLHHTVPTSAGVMVSNDPDAFVVIMPLRPGKTPDTMTPFTIDPATV